MNVNDKWKLYTFNKIYQSKDYKLKRKKKEEKKIIKISIQNYNKQQQQKKI